MRETENSKLWRRAKELFYRPRNEWTPGDEMVYCLGDYFNVPEDGIEKQRFKAIKYAFNHHYSNNLFYNKYCKDRGVKPDDIRNEDDFTKIPMIADTFFKSYPSEEPRNVYEWLYRSSSVDIGEFDFNGNSLEDFLGWAEKRLKGIVNHSSGTSGKFSIMFRDKVTYQRIFYIAVKSIFFDIIPPTDRAHFVYPGSTKTHLTMGRFIQEASRVFDDLNRHFLTDRPLTMEIIKLMSTGRAEGFKEKIEFRLLQKAMKKGQSQILELLEKLDREKKQVYMVTFPFQLFDLMKMMEKDGKILNLGESNSLIITGGGWKIHEHKKVSEKEFAEMIERNLGVPPSNYRDLYGMSEMNGLAIGCDGRYKHLTPWIYPMVLDDNQEPVGYDEWGRFAFLDPLANSYPGFMMSGDRVKILEECPECGKTGPVLESEITRLPGVEPKGCGNLMRELLATEMAK